jgi:hypothetical protein
MSYWQILELPNSPIFGYDRAGDLICSCDGISPIPDPSKYLSPSKEEYKEFKEIDWDFFCNCSMLIRQVIGETKKHKNPFSEEWESGLPVFICGGGSKWNITKKQSSMQRKD